MRHLVDVYNPQEFWFVKANDGYISEDPDVADRRTRTYKAGDADWTLIAAVMRDISQQLMDATEDHVVIEYDLPESAADREVLESWFRAGNPVMGDFGLEGDSRHRVWKVLQARPNAVVPVRSSVRQYSRVHGRPEANAVEAVLAAVDDSIRALNEDQVKWCESYSQ